MSNGKLESAEQIIPHLFNSHKRRSKAVFPAKLQQNYWQHFIQERWSDICGENLAKLCQVETLEENVLTIATQSSSIANELFMLKKQLIKKINFILQGMWVIKELKFHTQGFVEVKKESSQLPEKKISIGEENYGNCLRCGARLSFKSIFCCYCSREEKVLQREKIKELLLSQPWLDYADCLNYLKCDKIEFNAIKDSLKNYYFEQVRNDFADENEKFVAVMLLTGKAIAEMDERDFNNALAFLRRNKNVPTRRL